MAGVYGTNPKFKMKYRARLPARSRLPSPPRMKKTSFFLAIVGLLLSSVSLLLISSRHPRQAARVVVVYTSQDEVYAEPIFKQFEKQTGIQVKPIFDSEAVKTVGLVNRLLAEENNPQCDVFWNNEEFRTRFLAARGVFRETNAWASLGYRTRRMVINTNFLSPANAPRDFSDVDHRCRRDAPFLQGSREQQRLRHEARRQQHGGRSSAGAHRRSGHRRASYPLHLRCGGPGGG